MAGEIPPIVHLKATHRLIVTPSATSYLGKVWWCSYPWFLWREPEALA